MKNVKCKMMGWMAGLALATVAAPTVTVTDVSFDAAARKLTVNYSLSAPAVVTAEILTGDEVTIGSVLRFTSRITEELDWETVTYQWQTSADGEEWFDVEDADQATLTITVDETNVDSYWRLVVRD